MGVLAFLQANYGRVYDLITFGYNRLRDFWTWMYFSLRDFIISGGMSQIWNISNSVANIIVFINNNFWGLFNTVNALAAQFWALSGSLWRAIAALSTSLFNTIYSLTGTIWNAIYALSTSLFRTIYSLTGAIWNAIYALSSNLFNAIYAITGSLWNAISALSSSLYSTIYALTGSLWNALAALSTNLFNTLYSYVTLQVGNVIQIILGMISPLVWLMTFGWGALMFVIGTGKNILFYLGEIMGKIIMLFSNDVFPLLMEFISNPDDFIISRARIIQKEILDYIQDRLVDMLELALDKAW